MMLHELLQELAALATQTPEKGPMPPTAVPLCHSTYLAAQIVAQQRYLDHAEQAVRLVGIEAILHALNTLLDCEDTDTTQDATSQVRTSMPSHQRLRTIFQRAIEKSTL